jgi:hypothetical protein
MGFSRDSNVRHAGQGAERRHEPRDAVIGTLWLIDNIHGATARCTCIDASSDGMRLSAAQDARIEPGQAYELCSHLPGQSPPPGMGLIVSRHATVAWSHPQAGGIEFGVILDAARYRLPAEATSEALV